MQETESEPPPRVDGIGQKTAKSGAWLIGRHIVTSAVNILVMAILARRLSPADFALAALAQVLIRFTALLGSGGVASYIIYDKGAGREERANAAFWMNACAALVTCTAGLLLLPVIAKFYEMPELAGMGAAFLGIYFCSQLWVVPDALVKRTLDYSQLAFYAIILEILASVLSVLMAIRGYGAWSLVLPQLGIAPVSVAVVFLIARWRPNMNLGFRHWGTVFRYSRNSIVSETANLVGAEGDTLLIGKTLGASALGIYNMAWTTANIVSRNVSGVVGKLAMPALSAAAEDPDRLRLGVLKMMRILASISFPLLVGLFVLAEEFVLTVYGPKWLPCVVPLRILIVFAMRRAIGAPITAIYDAVGRPDIGMKLAVVLIPCYLASIWIGSSWGIVGVALAVTIVRTLHGLVQFEVSARLLGINMLELLRPLIPALSASIVMGLLVYLAKVGMALVIHPPPPISLALLIVLGAGASLVLLRTAFRSVARDVLLMFPNPQSHLRARLTRLLAVG